MYAELRKIRLATIGKSARTPSGSSAVPAWVGTSIIAADPREIESLGRAAAAAASDAAVATNERRSMDMADLVA
jgi:hypothetical protein